MITSLNRDLAEITGFAAVSAQPNSGAQVLILSFSTLSTPRFLLFFITLLYLPPLATPSIPFFMKPFPYHSFSPLAMPPLQGRIRWLTVHPRLPRFQRRLTPKRLSHPSIRSR